MKITFITHTPGRGGSTSLLMQLEPFFRERGHHTTVLTSMDDPDPVVPRYEVVPLDQGTPWRPRLAVLRERIETTSPDLVYSISGRDELDVLRFLRFPRVRHISSLENNPFTNIPYWLQQMDGYLDGISTNTPDVLDTIRSFGVRQFRGLNAPYLFPDEIAALPDIKPRGKNVAEVCYVGRLESFLKRAHWLPDVIARCRTLGRPLRWHIYGDGPCKSHIETQIAKAGCQSLVTIHGWCDRTALLQKLREHHIFFLCSRSEGLPVAMVEAMACGLACVVPEVHAGISYALKNGGGWMYAATNPLQAAHALVHATQDVELLDRTGAIAQVQARALFLNKRPELEQLEKDLMSLKHNGRIADLRTARRFLAVKPHVSILRRFKATFGIGKELCPG